MKKYPFSLSPKKKLVLKKETEINPGISNLPLMVYLKAVDYNTGTLVIRISNQSGYSFTVDESFSLSKYRNGSWIKYPFPENYQFGNFKIILADIDEVDLHFDLSIFPKLTKGLYRFEKQDLSCTFELVTKE